MTTFGSPTPTFGWVIRIDVRRVEEADVQRTRGRVERDGAATVATQPVGRAQHGIGVNGFSRLVVVQAVYALAGRRRVRKINGAAQGIERGLPRNARAGRAGGQASRPSIGGELGRWRGCAGPTCPCEKS